MAELDDIKAMFKATKEEFGGCDVLVNNAGITKDGLAMRMKPKQWQDVIDVNLSGVFYCSQQAFTLMAKQRSGRIINMSSVVGLFGNPGQANYASAKGGVCGLTMSNAKEFAGRGVTVNAVCPGFIGTEMANELGDEMLEKVKGAIPLGRLGERPRGGDPAASVGRRRVLVTAGTTSFDESRRRRGCRADRPRRRATRRRVFRERRGEFRLGENDVL